jgi:hypothetical protein
LWTLRRGGSGACRKGPRQERSRRANVQSHQVSTGRFRDEIKGSSLKANWPNKEKPQPLSSDRSIWFGAVDWHCDRSPSFRVTGCFFLRRRSRQVRIPHPPRYCERRLHRVHPPLGLRE